MPYREAGRKPRVDAFPSRSTLLAENVGQDYAELRDGLGSVRIWHLGHRIGIFECSGRTRAEHAQFVVDYHARFVETHERPYYSFGNWSNLQAYTSDVRVLLTEWQLKMAYEELHVSHDSPVLAISIAVANAVLPTKVVVVRTEELLDDQLAIVRKRHGL